MKLYIAGPMTGKPNYNYAAFDAMRDALQAAGHTCVSPCDMNRDLGFDGTHQIAEDQRKAFSEDAVVRNVFALAKCDVEGIIVLRDFGNSKGTKVEIAVAKLLGLPIFYPCIHSGALRDNVYYHKLNFVMRGEFSI